MSEFGKVMSERSDFELFEAIKYKRNNYISEALDAAEREFEKRNVSPEELAVFEQTKPLLQESREKKSKTKS